MWRFARLRLAGPGACTPPRPGRRGASARYGPAFPAPTPLTEGEHDAVAIYASFRLLEIRTRPRRL